MTGTISGLLGLGWQGISSSGAVPLVQALSQSGNLTSQVFAFGFDAYSASSTSSSNIAPGGTMTIGATDSSLFTGSINWNNIATPTGYWAIALDDVTVSGRSVGLSTRDAVIDTGTCVEISSLRDKLATHSLILSQVFDWSPRLCHPCHLFPNSW